MVWAGFSISFCSRYSISIGSIQPLPENSEAQDFGFPGLQYVLLLDFSDFQISSETRLAHPDFFGVAHLDCLIESWDQLFNTMLFLYSPLKKGIVLLFVDPCQ
jgi:hypothetical protein